MTSMKWTHSSARRAPGSGRPGLDLRKGRALVLAALACSMLVACAWWRTPKAVQSNCPPTQRGCPVEVVFTDAGLGERVARVGGRLSASQPHVSYVFPADKGDRLRLMVSDSSLHLTLTQPDGKSESADLRPEIALREEGKYVLRVAPSAMASSAQSDYKLEVRLSRAP